MAEKILVIDDSIMIRKMVKNILAGKYEVLEANDGKSGLRSSQTHGARFSIAGLCDA
jgi:PleD family two-component response regulator